jgi:hypothetical protein
MIKDYAKMLAEQQSLLLSQPTAASDTSEWQPTGKLVNEDGNVRFVDSPLLGVIYEEVRRCLDPFAPDTCLQCHHL